MSANLLTKLSYKRLTMQNFRIHLSYNYTTMINSRRLKIHTRYQIGTYRMTTVPEIRLKGKWLDKLGFKEGQMST